MKNIQTIFTVILFSIISIHKLSAQDESEKCVGKGKFIIDAYYGYPYLAGKYVKDVANNNNNFNNSNGYSSNGDLQVSNLNHIGGKCEYMLNRMLGLGLEYSFAAVTGKYSEISTGYQNGTYVNQINHYTARMTKQRFLAKINIHFATSKYLDPYATAGLGYKVALVTSDNPNDQNSVYDVNHSFLNVVPVAFRLGIGLRYFFIKNIGICAEAGIGGPLIQGGLCGKF
ncbi:MAG: outer membrane beta-barrel protein [Bacteroidota bacterium]